MRTRYNKPLKVVVEPIFNQPKESRWSFRLSDILVILLALLTLLVAHYEGSTSDKQQTEITSINLEISKIESLSRQAQQQINILHGELEELKKLNGSTGAQLELMNEEKHALVNKYNSDVIADREEWHLFITRTWQAHEELFFSRRINSVPQMEESDEYMKFAKDFMDRQVAEASTMCIYNKYLGENIYLKKACILYRDFLIGIRQHTEQGAEASMQELIKFTCASQTLNAHAHRKVANSEHALHDFEKYITESKNCTHPE